MTEDEKKENDEKGVVRIVTEVFVEKMKELQPKEAAVVFFGLVIVFVFGTIGFTSTIATGVLKLVQVVGQSVVAN